MVYLSCMTTTTSSDFPSFLVCCNCGHEHQAIDLDDIVTIDADGYVRQVMCADQIKDETAVMCADEDACERRRSRMEPLPDEPEDPGIDPEPDTDEDEGEPFDCEDLTGQDREAGWDD